MNILFRNTLGAVAVAGTLAVAGCAGDFEVVDHSPGVYAEVEPPAPQVEVVPAPPFSGAVWVGGRWNWQSGRHVWVAGRYVRPRAGYVYRPHAWSRAGNRWHYAPGRWDRR